MHGRAPESAGPFWPRRARLGDLIPPELEGLVLPPGLSKTPRGESPPAPPLWLDFPLCFDRGGQTVANHRGQRREFGLNLLVFEGLVMQIPSWGSSRRDSKGSQVAPRGSQEVPRDPQRVPGSSQEAPGTSGEPKIMKNQWGFEGRSAETMQLSTIPRSRKPKTSTPSYAKPMFPGSHLRGHVGSKC